MPVLDNNQRHEIGAMYTQRSKFEAKRLGAAMVSEHIAGHLRGALSGRPAGWRPLVYCWRGGSRSAAMAHVMRLSLIHI